MRCSSCDITSDWSVLTLYFSLQQNQWCVVRHVTSPVTGQYWHYFLLQQNQWCVVRHVTSPVTVVSTDSIFPTSAKPVIRWYMVLISRYLWLCGQYWQYFFTSVFYFSCDMISDWRQYWHYFFLTSTKRVMRECSCDIVSDFVFIYVTSNFLTLWSEWRFWKEPIVKTSWRVSLVIRCDLKKENLTQNWLSAVWRIGKGRWKRTRPSKQCCSFNGTLGHQFNDCQRSETKPEHTKD